MLLTAFNDLYSFVLVNLAIQLIVGNLEDRQNSTIEACFTHFGSREVVDGADGLLLHARSRRVDRIKTRRPTGYCL